MFKVQIKHFSCTTAQKFFIEKVIELLDPTTIDSYRLRLHNPLSILCELFQVINEINKGRLKSNDYATTLIYEAQALLTSEKELKFNSLSKKYFNELIKLNNGKKLHFDQIYYSTGLIINDNSDYINVLFNKIESEINEINKDPNADVVSYKALNGIIGFFFIELIRRGYSKPYLFNFFKSIFFAHKHGTFQDRLDILKTLINRKKETFKVVIGINYSVQKKKIEILDSGFKLLTTKEKKDIINKSNSKIKDFFNKYDDHCWFYQLDVEALDFFSSVKIARNKIQLLLDAIHMGHSDSNIEVTEECISIGAIDPTRSSSHKLKFYLDGYYQSDQKLYEEFLKKIKSIQHRKISWTTKSKINSGLRYLRLGFESPEIENKLLNYWIGIEYLFSSSEDDSNTVIRLRNYFKKCHSVIYFKRNLKYFNDMINVNGLTSSITGYVNDLSYLAEVKTYDFLLSKFNDFPLLGYRANSYKEQLEKQNFIRDTLIKHQQNLDWNLNRIYRLRNDIVHNAAIQPNIENITAHLRYYLVFILNGLLDFLINEPIDVNNDKELTIDDYFIIQEILSDNILNDINYQAYSYLLTRHNPVEYLT